MLPGLWSYSKSSTIISDYGMRTRMVEAAQTHVHKYDTAISRAYHRIAERRGRKVAIVAAARKLLLCCYSVLKSRRSYHDQI